MPATRAVVKAGKAAIVSPYSPQKKTRGKKRARNDEAAPRTSNELESSDDQSALMVRVEALGVENTSLKEKVEDRRRTLRYQLTIGAKVEELRIQRGIEAAVAARNASSTQTGPYPTWKHSGVVATRATEPSTTALSSPSTPPQKHGFLSGITNKVLSLTPFGPKRSLSNAKSSDSAKRLAAHSLSSSDGGKPLQAKRAAEMMDDVESSMITKKVRMTAHSPVNTSGDQSSEPPNRYEGPPTKLRPLPEQPSVRQPHEEEVEPQSPIHWSKVYPTKLNTFSEQLDTPSRRRTTVKERRLARQSMTPINNADRRAEILAERSADKHAQKIVEESQARLRALNEEERARQQPGQKRKRGIQVADEDLAMDKEDSDNTDEEHRRAKKAKMVRVDVDKLAVIPARKPGDSTGTFRFPDMEDDEMDIDEEWLNEHKYTELWTSRENKMLEAEKTALPPMPPTPLERARAEATKFQPKTPSKLGQFTSGLSTPATLATAVTPGIKSTPTLFIFPASINVFNLTAEQEAELDKVYGNPEMKKYCGELFAKGLAAYRRAQI